MESFTFRLNSLFTTLVWCSICIAADAGPVCLLMLLLTPAQDPKIRQLPPLEERLTERSNPPFSTSAMASDLEVLTLIPTAVLFSIMMKSIIRKSHTRHLKPRFMRGVCFIFIISYIYQNIFHQYPENGHELFHPAVL